MGLSDIFALSKCRAKYRSPIYILMVRQRQMHQQDRNCKKARFDNCTRVYAEHVKAV